MPLTTLTTPTTPFSSSPPRVSLAHHNHGFFHPKITFFPPKTSIKASTFLTPHPKTDPNHQIRASCELGHLQNAIFLLSTASARIDPNTLCSLLQLCAEQKSLEDGRKVHSMVESSGLDVDGALGSKLVFMYLNCGDLREARRVFDTIRNEKVFLWNFIISEYAKIGEYRESVGLYTEMRELGVEPNYYTFSSVLKCFGALKSAVEGEKAHGLIVRMGYGDHTTVGNALVAFYSKCGKLEDARKVFDEMTERDVISWNSIVGGYAWNGLEEAALEAFELMRFEGFDADVATMVSVLPACAEKGELLLGRTIHAHVMKDQRFMGRVTVYNSLVDMYWKCGDLDAAVRVFERMEKKSVVSWTSMLAGYARQGKCEKAVELFWQMQAEGAEPDLFTVTSVLNVCATNGSLESGKDVHDYIMKNRLQSNLFVANALMDMYAKGGSLEDARVVFNQMPVKDAVSWNTVIGGYSKNSLSNEALRLLVDMQRESKPNGVTMACVLPACASVSALEKGREIHGYIMRNGLFSDGYVANALIDMYAKCGALLLARLLFDATPAKNLVSWTAMIAGYGMHGCGREAITLFDEMQSSGITPDGISFVAIIYACSHSGLVDEGWRFFNIMRNDYKIVPKLEHYACVVDLLSRAGRLTKAFKFIEAMPVEPDSTVWGALLCGCRVHRDVKLAEKVAEKVFELEPDNTGFYVLLANIYAEAEKWQEVKTIRERIGRRGLKKTPGCSWIEIKSKLYVFVSGDRSNQQYKKMESLLEKVRAGMKNSGIVPNMRYSLIASGDDRKEEVLCGHSEKLAMAYGILNLPYGKPVRITKNLRVCGDCHETAKFMSKMFEKEIVLRDSNRFHQFKDGRCSCRGYW